MSRKIAFIGLGAMGQPMAANIQRKGTHLTVYDTDPARMEPLRDLGAHLAGSVAETARDAQTVITMLPATQHVEEVVLGAGSVADAIVPGGGIMDMSTIAPTGTDRIAAACASRGITFIDAPVGRLVIHAQKGESLFMVGVTTIRHSRRLNPCLRKWARRFTAAGPLARGSAPNW